MKYLSYFLLLTCFCSYSQNIQGFTIGEPLSSSCIAILSDTLEVSAYVTQEGICYSVYTKYLGKNKKDLDLIKNKIKPGLSWKVDPEVRPDRYTTYICEAHDDKLAYTIYYEGLDYDARGLLVTAVPLDLGENRRYASYHSREWDRYKSIDEYHQSPNTETIKQRLKNDFAATVEWEREMELTYLREEEQKNKLYKPNDIVLPYKVKFGMTKDQLKAHLKLLFGENSITSVVYGENDPTLYSSSITYHIVDENSSKLDLNVDFYKNKAYSFSYYHDWQESNDEVYDRIQEIEKKYNIVTADSHTIYLTMVKQHMGRIEGSHVQAAIEKRKSIGKKM